MATLTIADLDNGKRDLETVDAVANSQADTTPTRYGPQTLTLAGALRRLGWKAPVPYAAGISITGSTTTVERGGIVYRPDPAIVPFTTGAWNPDKWRVVQNTQDSNLVYGFDTLVAAQSAAATLPEGSALIVKRDVSAGGDRMEYMVTAGKVSDGVSIDFRRSPQQFADYAAISAAAPRLNAGQIVESLYDLMRYDVAPGGGLVNERSVLPDNDYSKLKNYTGRSTRLSVADNSGTYWWVRRGTAAENGGTVLKDAMARSWKREFSGAVNVLWFGAKGAGGHDDTQAINDAIAFGPGSVFFPDGEYATTAPIYTDGNISLRGASKGKVKIKKTTNTPGVGNNLALDGTTDDYVQNAVIILRHPDNGYNYGTSIRDITLESMFISDYGIYAPRASGLFLENVSIVGCRVGYQTHDSWMCQFNRVEVDAVTRAGLAGDTYGWTTKSYGFVFTPKVASTPTGTSCTFNSCWAHDCHIGWEINYLEYSTLNSCGADNISKGPYRFTNSELTLNSCATENVQLNGESALAVVGGNVTLSSFRTYRIRGSTSGTTAMLYADGARVVLNTCRLDDFFQVNSSFNFVIQNGSTVVNNNSRLTGNGNSSISYSGGSVLTMMGASNPHVITSTGIKFFAFAP